MVDHEALERLGVRQIIEVPSVASPDGRGVHYEPDALVAAVASVIAAHRAQKERQRAQQGGRAGWTPGLAPVAELTRRNSI